MDSVTLLSRYLGRQFLFWLLSVFAGLATLFSIVDLVELFRRSSGKQQVTSSVLFQMSFVKIPYLLQDLFPFIVLFGALFAFWRLARRNELNAIRSAGISVWSVMAPGLVISFFLGVFQITAYNPVAAALHARYEALETKYFVGANSQLSISQTGLWLRQNSNKGQDVIHALKIRKQGRNLEGVIIFSFDTEGHFLQRIDAATASLQKNHWELHDVLITGAEGRSRKLDTHILETNLTLEKIRNTFQSAKSLSLWQLPNFIDILEEAGFSTKSHRLNYHAILSTPVLFCAMVLIAMCFSLKSGRQINVLWMMAGGIVCGFLLYLLTKLFHALGVSTGVPAILAAWIPAVASVMLGVFGLLHLEDG